MANFKKTGDLYVDKGNSAASDANAGTDPDLPKLTIQGALDVATEGQKIIVGDNLYAENSLKASSSVTIEADGIVIVEGDNINDFYDYEGFTNEIIFINLIVINHLNFINQTAQNQNYRLIGCTIINSQFNSNTLNSNKRIYIDSSRFINSNVDVRSTTLSKSGLTTQINNSIFINSLVKCNIKVINSVIDGNLELLNDAIGADPSNRDETDFCNVNGSILYDSLFNDLASFQQFNPTLLQNCIDLDSKFNRVGGEVATLDFSVLGSSPLLGAGENGTNIGNVKRGIQSERFSPSVINGTVNNIVFDGQRWQINGSNTTGTLKSDVIDFGLTVKSPTPTIKGLVNFLDNVPDFNNALLDPNKLDLEVRYAIIGEDISAKDYKPFLFNERLELDNIGKSNGEANFDWANTVTIPMKELQYKITLRQDFNG